MHVRKYGATVKREDELKSALKYMMLNWFLEDKEDITREEEEKESQTEGIVKTLGCKYTSNL